VVDRPGGVRRGHRLKAISSTRLVGIGGWSLLPSVDRGKGDLRAKPTFGSGQRDHELPHRRTARGGARGKGCSGALVLHYKVVLPCNAWEKQTADGASCSAAYSTFVSWP
jgi:hypothetical protein